MFTEQFFDLLLDFGTDWRGKKVDSDQEADEVDIYVEYIGREKVYDYAPARRWRHLDTMQFKTYINASLPRMEVAGKVKTLTPPWAEPHERHTKLVERWQNSGVKIMMTGENDTITVLSDGRELRIETYKKETLLNIE